MITRSAMVAAAAASLFLSGVSGTANAEHHEGAAAKIKCEGVNSCKGHSDCKTAQNSCKGQNGCGGKGFLMMTQAECDAAKAKAADETKKM